MSMLYDRIVDMAVASDAKQAEIDDRIALIVGSAREPAMSATDAQFKIFLKLAELHSVHFGNQFGERLLLDFLKQLLSQDVQSDIDEINISKINFETAEAFLNCGFLERSLHFDLESIHSYSRNLALAAYAWSGVLPDEAVNYGKTPGEIRRWAEELQGELRKIPEEWSDIAAPLQVLLRAVQARARLVYGEPVSLEGLAALSKLSLKRVQNVASRKNGPIPHRNGLVPATKAIAWLHARGFILEEIEREDTDDDDGPVHLEDDNEESPVRLPVDRYGDPFGPKCRGRRGYKIGPKDKPVYIDDFYKALARLQAMKPPQWRRNDPNRGWVVTKGRGWVDCSPSEIAVMFSACSMKAP